MLLVETEPVSQAMLSPTVGEELIFSFDKELIGLFILELEVVLSSMAVSFEENDVGSEASAPIFTPVRRNL